MEQHEENKNQDKEVGALGNSITLSFFDGDADSHYLYKKTEKLVAALYVITNLFPDDPLKLSLRDSSLSLLSHAVLFSDKIGNDKHAVFNILTTTLVETISKFEVAFFAGMLTQMNYSIMRRELEALLTFLEDRGKKAGYRGHIVLDKNFFGEHAEPTASMPLFGTEVSSQAATVAHKGQYKGHINSGTKSFKNSEQDSQKEVRATKGHHSKPVNKSSRTDLIISLLKKKSGLMIKDFSAIIKDCSEKTIQRELLSLVAKGVLKKEGERRWSKYSLR